VGEIIFVQNVSESNVNKRIHCEMQ